MEKRILIMKSFLQACFFGVSQRKNITALIAIFSLVSFFEFMFSHDNHFVHGVGLNYALVSLVSIAIAIVVHQPSVSNRVFWWAVLGSLLMDITLLVHQSGPVITMFFISHFLVIGSLHNPKIENPILAFAQWLILQVCLPVNTLRFITNRKNWSQDSWGTALKLAKFLVIPIAVSFVFIFMYSQANSKFYTFFVEPISSLFSKTTFFTDSLFIRLLASFFIVPLILPLQFQGQKITLPRVEKYIKRKKSKVRVKYLFKNMDLNNELKISTFTLIGLNVIVFFFNILDLIYVWFDFSAKSPSQMSEYVHEGTDMTILSILVGVGLLLGIFRQNLNFHPMGNLLKKLSYAWIIQNAFLALSTFMRNLQYVNQYGLTTKRLGVAIFIVSVLLALLFTYHKIVNKHSLRFFTNKVVMGIFLVLIGYSMVDSSKLIISHAIHVQKENVDLHYLRRHAYGYEALLKQNIELLSDKSLQQIYVTETAGMRFEYERNWRAWNWKDYKARSNGLHFKVISDSNASSSKPIVHTNPTNVPVQCIDEIESVKDKSIEFIEEEAKNVNK